MLQRRLLLLSASAGARAAARAARRAGDWVCSCRWRPRGPCAGHARGTRDEIVTWDMLDERMLRRHGKSNAAGLPSTRQAGTAPGFGDVGGTRAQSVGGARPRKCDLSILDELAPLEAQIFVLPRTRHAGPATGRARWHSLAHRSLLSWCV